MSRFVLADKRPRVRYKTLLLNKNEFVLCLPNLKQFFYAAQVRFLGCECCPFYLAELKDTEITIESFLVQT